MNQYSLSALIGLIIFGMGLSALMLGVASYFENRQSVSVRKMFYVCISVFFWDAGYAWMSLCHYDTFAYVPRAVALISINVYMYFALSYTAYLANFPKKIITIYTTIYAIISTSSWLMLITDRGITFTMTKYGYYYYTDMSIFRAIQFAGVLSALIMYYIILHYWKKRILHKREAYLIHRFNWFGVILFIGYSFDTLIPIVFHTPSIPGSSISAFFSALLLFFISKKYKAFDISVTNVSHYVFRDVDTPILIFDWEGNLALSNDKAVSYFKVANQSLKGLKKEDLFDIYTTGEDTKDAYDGILDEDIYMVSGRKRFCKLAETKVFDEFDELLYSIIFVQDITDELKSLQEMQESRKEAQAANQAKSNFLANTSHEIRTPMNAIIGMSDIILQNENLSEEINSQIMDIKSAGESLLDIINDILDISKIEAGKYELIEDYYIMPSMLHDSSNIIRVKTKESNVNFKLKINPTVPNELIGDVVRIRQILMNILGNAVKFTQKGSIMLNVDWNQNTVNPVLFFDVTDTGIGIKPEDIDSIFGAFNQVDTTKNRNIEGTGLGLSISKHLTEMMGGEIWVESEYGKGSTFHIKIPQKLESYEKIGETVAESLEEKRYLQKIKEKPIEIIPKPNAHILIVDDNRVNLAVATGIMKPYKMHIDTANNGPEAIEMVKQNHYDLIFMDHMMPEMDGIDTTKHIQEMDDGQYGGIPIVALTANAVGDILETFLNHGMQDFLAKPINKRELDAILNKWL